MSVVKLLKAEACHGFPRYLKLKNLVLPNVEKASECC